MEFFSQQSLFESVEWIVVVWVVSIALLMLITFRVGQNVRRFRWREVWKCEHGANYALQVVLIIPPYALLMCCALETSFMLTTKVGTIYASFAGSRTGIVQYTHLEAKDAEEEVERAAKRAMVPFATGMTRHQKGISVTSIPPGFTKYLEMYTKNTILDSLRPKGKTAGSAYLLMRYRYAFAKTKVTSSVPKGQLPESYNDPIEITVEYKYPMNIRLLGIIFGADKVGGKYYYPIKSTAMLQYEGPHNDEQTMGITYGSR